MAKLWRRIKQTIAVLSLIIFGIFIGWRSFIHFTAYDDSLAEIEETWETDPLDPRLKSLFYMQTATLAEIKELLAMGIDINSRDKNGESLLYDALFFKRDEIAIFLIEKGADANAKNDYGSTPLHWIRNAEITKLLLDAGADVNVKTKNGRTPLHNARNAESIKLLLDAGADIDARDSVNGETPLHQAAYRADLVSTKFLLDAGADVNARDDDGKTPFFKAVHGIYVYQIYEREEHYDTCEEGECTEAHYEPTSNVTYEETIAVINLLIEYGADVKAKDNKGNFVSSDFLDNYLIKIGVPSNY